MSESEESDDELDATPPAPETVQSPNLTTVQSPNPATVQSPYPATVQSPYLTTVQSPYLTTVQPPALETFQPPALETVQSPYPATVQSPNLTTVQPPALETFQPPALETVQSPDPATVQSPDPATVQSPDPATVQSPDPATVQSPDPTTVKETTIHPPNPLSPITTQPTSQPGGDGLPVTNPQRTIFFNYMFCRNAIQNEFDGSQFSDMYVDANRLIGEISSKRDELITNRITELKEKLEESCGRMSLQADKIDYLNQCIEDDDRKLQVVGKNLEHSKAEIIRLQKENESLREVEKQNISKDDLAAFKLYKHKQEIEARVMKEMALEKEKDMVLENEKEKE